MCFCGASRGESDKERISFVAAAAPSSLSFGLVVAGVVSSGSFSLAVRLATCAIPMAVLVRRADQLLLVCDL